jgi:hypothetical protein
MAFENTNGQVTCQDRSYTTQNFDICATSKLNFEKLAFNPTLQCEFAQNEDQFLFYEKQAVRYGTPQREVMMRINSYMKMTYPMLNFDYHNLHIRQGSYPNQKINMPTWYSVGRA